MPKPELIPTTLEEVMVYLSKALSIEDQAAIISTPEKELIKLHHSLGRWIRNDCKLWTVGPLSQHMKHLGFHHPDDMSMALIKEWWARMNNVPSTLEQDAKEDTKYWESDNEA